MEAIRQDPVEPFVGQSHLPGEDLRGQERVRTVRDLPAEHSIFKTARRLGANGPP